MNLSQKAPDKLTVRPPDILEKAFQFVMDKWNSEHNYTYACDQLKSIRQDLMVQHVKSNLTVRTYEAHARISLEMVSLSYYVSVMLWDKGPKTLKF